jgi:hypothetical protein
MRRLRERLEIRDRQEANGSPVGVDDRHLSTTAFRHPPLHRGDGLTHEARLHGSAAGSVTTRTMHCLHRDAPVAGPNISQQVLREVLGVLADVGPASGRPDQQQTERDEQAPRPDDRACRPASSGRTGAAGGPGDALAGIGDPKPTSHACASTPTVICPLAGVTRLRYPRGSRVPATDGSGQPNIRRRVVGIDSHGRSPRAVPTRQEDPLLRASVRASHYVTSCVPDGNGLFNVSIVTMYARVPSNLGLTIVCAAGREHCRLVHGRPTSWGPMAAPDSCTRNLWRPTPVRRRVRTRFE